MNGRTPQQLQATLDKQFNMVELRRLAFDLNIDDENLESKTKQDFILSLIKYAQRRNLTNDLWTLVENHQQDQSVRPKPSIWERSSLGTKVTIISVLVTIVGIVVTLMSVLPKQSDNDVHPTPTVPVSVDKFLVQVKVLSSEDQTPIDNVKVSIELADQLYPQQRTDSTGLAVFELPTHLDGQVARVIVDNDDQVESQFVTVTVGMRTVEFQIRP